MSNVKGVPKTTHGQSHTRLYKIWMGIKLRCCNKNHNTYKNYGAKGITICDEWIHDFSAFYDWSYKNGYNDGLTIDRIDNSKGYSPDNCRWATYPEQALNKSTNKHLTINGQTKTIKEWSDIYGIAQNAVYRRLDAGWDGVTSLTTPLQERTNDYADRLIEYNGETHTALEWSKILKVNYNAFVERLFVYGWDVGRAFTEPYIQYNKQTYQYNGESHRIYEWAKILGINQGAIRNRLKRGWSIEEALSVPLNDGITKRDEFIAYKGETKTLNEWADSLGINRNTLRSRLYHYNWPIEKAFSEPVKIRSDSKQRRI